MFWVVLELPGGGTHSISLKDITPPTRFHATGRRNQLRPATSALSAVV